MLFEKQCECAGTPRNPGQSGCLTEATRDVYKIYCHYYDADGNINAIPAGTVLNEAFITGKLNETDPTKRWYITPRIENLQAPQPEAETETIGNKDLKTGEEIKQPETYEHVKNDANPALLAFYDSIDCITLGEFAITRTGQVTGMNDGEGNLIPVKIENDTMSAQYGKPVQGTTQKVYVSYMVDELENDANRDLIDPSTIEYSALKWFNKQPQEVIAYKVSATTTALTVNLQKMFGGVNFKSPAKGFVTADVSPDLGVTTGEVFNKTTGLNVAGTLAEGDNGQYVFTYGVAISTSDVVEFTIFKEGYNMRTFTSEPAS